MVKLNERDWLNKILIKNSCYETISQTYLTLTFAIFAILITSVGVYVYIGNILLPLIIILILQIVLSLILHVRYISKADHMEKLGLDVLEGEKINKIKKRYYYIITKFWLPQISVTKNKKLINKKTDEPLSKKNEKDKIFRSVLNSPIIVVKILIISFIIFFFATGLFSGITGFSAVLSPNEQFIKPISPGYAGSHTEEININGTIIGTMSIKSTIYPKLGIMSAGSQINCILIINLSLKTDIYFNQSLNFSSYYYTRDNLYVQTQTFDFIIEPNREKIIENSVVFPIKGTYNQTFINDNMSPKNRFNAEKMAVIPYGEDITAEMISSFRIEALTLIVIFFSSVLAIIALCSLFFTITDKRDSL